MRILIGKLCHETNTFSSEIGDFERWSHVEWGLGEEILAIYDGKEDYISGMMRAAKEDGSVELIPTVSIADAGPLILKSALDKALGTLLDYVAKNQDALDGICLALHGAGCCEGVFDLEAHTLREVRKIVGDTIPITVTLDLHGNLGADMIPLAQGFFAVKQYPHVDGEAMGHMAMKSLIRHIRGEIQLKTGFVRLPMVVPPSRACTFEAPMLEFTEYVAAYAKEHDLLDASLMHGFPYSDVPCLGSSILTVTTGKDPQPSAEAIARHVWNEREKLAPACLSVQEAVDTALELSASTSKGYVVINEASDNPGGGAPCDGTWLLAELIRQDVPGSILGYIHDPETAIAAHKAGVGGKVNGKLGGKKDNIHGAPIDLMDAQVCALSNGETRFNCSMLFGVPVSYGRIARLRIGHVEVVVAENLGEQCFDNAPFFATGANIDHYRIVCVKSTNHFKDYYASRANAIVTADPPGIHTANFNQLTYHHIPRPIWPMDEEALY